MRECSLPALPSPPPRKWPCLVLLFFFLFLPIFLFWSSYFIVATAVWCVSVWRWHYRWGWHVCVQPMAAGRGGRKPRQADAVRIRKESTYRSHRVPRRSLFLPFIYFFYFFLLSFIFLFREFFFCCCCCCWVARIGFIVMAVWMVGALPLACDAGLLE